MTRSITPVNCISISLNYSQNEMRKRFFYTLSLSTIMFQSMPPKSNKPSKVYKRSDKEEMKDYPESYYQEIVKFTEDSRNWLL